MTDNTATFLIVLAVIAVVLYVFLSFFQGIQKDPRQMLKEYSQKFESAENLKLNYNFKLSAYSMFSLPDISMEFYKLNDDMKILTNIMGTTSASFIKNDKTITCTESSLSTFYTTNRLSCSISSSLYQQSMFKPKVDETLYNQTPVSYVGVKNIANRNCDDFIIKLNQTQMKSVSYPLTGLAISNITSTENASYVNYEICMDREYGYMALLNISYITYSQLSGKSTETNVMSMKVTEMSKGVTEDDLKIPIAFAIGSVSCSENSVKFNLTAFQNIITPTIKVELSSYSSNTSTSMSRNNLISGETYLIEMPTTKSLSGSYTVNVCIGSDCQSGYCYVYKTYKTSSTNPYTYPYTYP